MGFATSNPRRGSHNLPKSIRCGAIHGPGSLVTSVKKISKPVPTTATTAAISARLISFKEVARRYREWRPNRQTDNPTIRMQAINASCLFINAIVIRNMAQRNSRIEGPSSRSRKSRKWSSVAYRRVALMICGK